MIIIITMLIIIITMLIIIDINQHLRPGPYQQSYLRHAPCMREVPITIIIIITITIILISSPISLLTIIAITNILNNSFNNISNILNNSLSIAGPRRLSRLQQPLPGCSFFHFDGGKNCQTDTQRTKC